MKVRVNGSLKEYYTVWMEGDVVCMIDQAMLPFEFSVYRASTPEQVADAIRNMRVRGAPAIGVAACYGLAQAAIQNANLPADELKSLLREKASLFLSTRPTAVDMKNMVERVLRTLNKRSNSQQIVQAVLEEARRIAWENAEACRKIGEFGSQLITKNARLLVHCNPGALGTVDYGTALSIVRFAHAQGKNVYVYVTETRPWLQGRLTSWELDQEGIPYCLIADSAAGYYIFKKEVNAVLVGADRILPDGTVINKIGTYMLAVAAYENDVPFIVAAPTTTFDAAITCPKIEERAPREVTHVKGYDDRAKRHVHVRIHPDVPAKNPAFDVTPAKYVTAIVTEKGILKPNELKRIL
ncbi:MAG: S-methyl-5-thioribose-1-phosphate isomerase [Candidatus Freyarchaeota archaeon]|nr:S-methyl-5-thioribose-1-phosphate isomerase [Candidatus Bathyarchaeota archaeon]